MGGLFGGSSQSKTGPTPPSQGAADILLESLFPGSNINGAFGDNVGNFLGGLQAPVVSSLAGEPGTEFTTMIPGAAPTPGATSGASPTGTDTGQPVASALGGQPPGTILPGPGNNPGSSSGGVPQSGGGTTPPPFGGGNLPNNEFSGFSGTVSGQGGILPNLQAMVGPTVFQQFSAGKLDPASADIVSKALGQINKTPEQLNSQLTAGGVGKGLGPGQIMNPDIPNIGKLTAGIIKDLPQNMQTFINDTLSATDPATINMQLDKIANSLMAEAKQGVDTFGGQLMSQFSQQGLGSSGSAMLAFKNFGVQVATNVNAQIAQTQLTALGQLINARQIGVQLVNDLMTQGQGEQANIVRQNIERINAQAQETVASINASAVVQSRLVEAQAQLQLGQMQLTGQELSLLQQGTEFQQTEQQKAILTPYDILLQLATGTHPSSKSSGPAPSPLASIGDVAGGVGGILQGIAAF